MDNQHLYCHWDSHTENVLFNSMNDLDSHVKSHYQHDHVDKVQQEPVACHWDSCHELINLDEMWLHFKNYHYKDVQTPHDQCEPGHTHDFNQHAEHIHNHHEHNHHVKPSPEFDHKEFEAPSFPYARVHEWTTPPQIIPSINNPNLPTLQNPPIKSEEAKQPCICRWVTDGTPCGCMFPNSHELNNHLNSEHVARGCKTYVCNWEGCRRECKPFTQRQKMVRHLQTHAKNWSFKCNLCGHLSNDDVSLRQHQRTHSGEKPHVCKVCGKRFTAMSSLTVHVRVHTGEKPLVCKFPGCDKRFSESSNLNKHMKTHMAKTVECPYCDCRFCRRDQLHRHINVVHQKEPSAFAEPPQQLEVMQ